MNLLDRIKGGGESARDIATVDDYAALLNQFAFNGIGYGYGSGLTSGVQQTLKGPATEMAPNNFRGLAEHAYAANGIVQQAINPKFHALSAAPIWCAKQSS